MSALCERIPPREHRPFSGDGAVGRGFPEVAFGGDGAFAGNGEPVRERAQASAQTCGAGQADSFKPGGFRAQHSDARVEEAAAFASGTEAAFGDRDCGQAWKRGAAGVFVLVFYGLACLGFEVAAVEYVLHGRCELQVDF